MSLKNIQKTVEMFPTVDAILLEQKRVASVKCRLAKQKFRKDYDVEMTKILSQEQMLKEAKAYLSPKKLTVTTMTVEDIALLNYDETIKAIKSIQSKKCNTQYLTEDKSTNVEYQDALRIEKLLLDHKALVKPIEETVVKKSTINETIQHLESLELTQEEMIKKLKELLGQ